MEIMHVIRYVEYDVPGRKSRGRVILARDKDFKSIVSYFKTLFPEYSEDTLEAWCGELRREVPPKEGETELLFDYSIQDVLVTDKGLYKVEKLFNQEDVDANPELDLEGTRLLYRSQD